MKTLQLKLRPGSVRYAAAVAGQPTYSTGKPCRRGHKAPRRTASGTCSACQAEWLALHPEKGAIHAKTYRSQHKHAIAQRELARNKADKVDRPWRLPTINARDRSRDKGVPFSLTMAWAEKTWTGLCAITGLPFNTLHGLAYSHPFSPSIDRIDPAKGYVPNNCRFILAAVNSFRGLMNDEEMLTVAKAIVSGPCAGTNGGANHA